jgi:hypothetical protein
MKKLLSTLLFLSAFLCCQIVQGATFTDNFNRSDNTDLGSSWDSGYTDYDNLQIVSNSARGVTVDNSSALETVNSPSFADDQWASVKLSTLSPPTSFGGAWIILRAASPGTDTYYFCGFIYYADTLYTEIWKSVAGEATNLSGVTTTTWSSGDVLKCSVVGTSISLEKNGVQQTSTTDSDISSGRPGLRINLETAGNGGAVTDVQLDDFTASDVFGGASVVRRRPMVLR